MGAIEVVQVAKRLKTDISLKVFFPFIYLLGYQERKTSFIFLRSF